MGDSRRSLRKLFARARGKGRRMSNGVAYKINLLQKGWFGSYECRIHRSLLDISSKRIDTDEFEVCGHRWSVSLEHTSEGYLAAYLHSKNTVNVDLIYSITILNHSSGKQHRFSGDNYSFPPNDYWGNSRLAPISEILDPDFGFLVGSSFDLRTDLRFVLPDNDTHTCSTDTESGSFTWELKDLMERGPLRMISPTFTAANYQWQLWIYPRGEKHGASHAGVYLRCVSDLSGSVRVNRTITMLNHHSDRMTVSKEAVDTFRPEQASFGWPEFIDIKSLKDEGLGFVKDGRTTITAYVEVLKDAQTMDTQLQGLPPQQPSTDEDLVCIYCLDKKQTAGVLHGKTMHKCVCGDCIKILEREKFPCPICQKKVDSFIYEIF